MSPVASMAITRGSPSTLSSRVSLSKWSVKRTSSRAPSTVTFQAMTFCVALLHGISLTRCSA